MLFVLFAILFTCILIAAGIVASACFWQWFHAFPSREDRIRFIDTPDEWRLSLHRYQGAGDDRGLPVVLCHGLASNRYVFDMRGAPSLAPFLRDEGRDVWSAELRGAGMSAKPGLLRWDVPCRWRFEDCVLKDVPSIVSSVIEETGAPAVHWVGHSMGGMVMVAYLSMREDPRIASVTLIGSPVDFSGIDPRLVARSKALRPIASPFPFFPIVVLAKALSPFVGSLPAPLSSVFNPANTERVVGTKVLAVAAELVSPTSLWRDLAGFMESGVFGPGDGSRYLDRLPAVPILALVGAADGMAAPASVFRIPPCDGVDREVVILGRESGCLEDYGHTDLLVGPNALQEVFPRVVSWIRKHDPR